MRRFRINQEEKKIVEKIVQKFERLRSVRSSHASILFEDDLWRMLTKEERSVAEKFIEIDPSMYGSTESFVGMTTAKRENLAAIRRQSYVSRFDGERKKIRTQYLPRRVFRAYERMNVAMHEDIGSGLLVLSGYRTPWYQLLLFLHKYTHSAFRVSRAIQWVALPGWSQHGDAVHTAIDFMTERGEYFGGHFAGTKEYEWLRANATKFSFEESFPKDNDTGVGYEPWHWQHVA